MTGWDDLYADESWRKWAERPPLPITEHLMVFVHMRHLPWYRPSGRSWININSIFTQVMSGRQMPSIVKPGARSKTINKMEFLR